MKKVKLLKLDGTSGTDVSIPESLIAKKIAKQAIFDTVIAENASTRQGTHSTLTKAEVRGGGKKPWMQKHTGNARQGSIRNPHWVGGGTAFGPKPTRNYEFIVPRKVTRLAFRSAIATRLADMMALENTKFPKISTKNICEFLKKANLLNEKVLFIVNEDNQNFLKSAKNIARVTAKSWKGVSTKDVLHANKIVIQEQALTNLAKAVG